MTRKTGHFLLLSVSPFASLATVILYATYFNRDDNASATMTSVAIFLTAICAAISTALNVAILAPSLGFLDGLHVSSEQLTPWIWKGPITNAIREEKQQIEENAMHIALQTMERRLEFVPAFELVVYGDGITEVRYITTVAADILGHKQEKPGFDILDYIVEADRERVFKSLTKPTPGKKWLQEFTTVTGRRVRACANSHLNNRGDTVWTGVLEDVGMQHDLTRVRRERDMQKTVAEQLKTRCNFLAHEVRNTHPLPYNPTTGG